MLVHGMKTVADILRDPEYLCLRLQAYTTDFDLLCKCSRVVLYGRLTTNV